MKAESGRSGERFDQEHDYEHEQECIRRETLCFVVILRLI
jgi:hypothetical protein